MPTVLVNTSTDGAQLVAAPAAKCFIRVSGFQLSSPSAIVTVTLKSNNSTVIYQSKAFGASPFNDDMPVDPNVTIDCLPGESLNIGLSAAVNVSGVIEYVVLGMVP